MEKKKGYGTLGELKYETWKVYAKQVKMGVMTQGGLAARVRKDRKQWRGYWKLSIVIMVVCFGSLALNLLWEACTGVHAPTEVNVTCGIIGILSSGLFFTAENVLLAATDFLKEHDIEP